MALTQISTAGVKDDIVTAAKIADDAVTEALISDESVDEARLKISNAGTNGQFLQKQSSNTGGLTWADASVGGGTGTDYNDSVKVRFGTGNDLEIYHDGSHSFIRHDGGGSLLIKTDAADEDIYIDAGQSLHLRTTTSFESAISCIANGAVELYYDNSKKLETTSTGAAVYDYLQIGSNDDDPATLELKYSTVPSYLTSTYDGTVGETTLSMNVPRTSDGSASWGSHANTGWGSAAIQVLSHSSSGGYVTVLTSASDNTNPTERMRIDSSGFVGINQSSPETLLNIKGNDTAYSGDIASGAIIQAEDSAGRKVQLVAPGASAEAGVGTPTNHTLTLFTGNTERARLDTNGHFKINDGDIQIGTSGHGIDFSATSDATGKTSELLDDYEEGSWTPSLENGGSATAYNCRYTKIGREVTIHAYAYYSSTPNDSEDFQINGLPFTVSNSTSNTAGGFMYYGASLDVTTIAPFASGNSTAVRFYAIDGAGGGGVKVNSFFYGTGPAATRYLAFKLFYYTD